MDVKGQLEIILAVSKLPLKSIQSAPSILTYPGIRALTFTLVHAPACMQLPRQEMEEFCAVLLLSNGFSVSSRVAFRVIISQLAIMLHIWQKAISTWLIVFIGRPDSRLFCEISATFVFTLHVIEPSIHSPPFKCSVDQFFFVHCSSVLSYC